MNTVEQLRAQTGKSSSNKAVVDRRLRPRCGVTLSTRHFRVAIYARALYIFISPNRGSSSMKYSKHNIQLNEQTKNKKKLTTVSSRRL